LRCSAKSLHRAYRLREKSDYSTTFKIEAGEVRKSIKEAKEFVDAIEEFILKN